MNFKTILSSALASGLLVSSAQAYIALGGTTRNDAEVAQILLTSTTAPVIGPLIEEAQIPQGEVNNHVYSQAVMVASDQNINNTANFIAAMSSLCQMSEKEVAQAVIKVFEANPNAELTCSSLK